MDWQALSAIGSMLCALATFFAALVALMIGVRERRISVAARGVFLDDSSFEAMQEHPNCFRIELICNGNQPVFITHIIEGAKFERGRRGFRCYLSSKVIRRRKSFLYASIPDFKIGKYWMAYPMRETLKLDPGESAEYLIRFSRMKAVQEERKELGIFRLNDSLLLYAVDITGKRYKIESGATPNSFLEHGTCKMR